MSKPTAPPATLTFVITPRPDGKPAIADVATGLWTGVQAIRNRYRCRCGARQRGQGRPQLISNAGDDGGTHSAADAGIHNSARDTGGDVTSRSDDHARRDRRGQTPSMELLRRPMRA